jgi:hypothetical protein
MARAGARPGDWKVTPMPEARRDVASGRVFTAEEMARLRDGLRPEEMEALGPATVLPADAQRTRAGAAGGSGPSASEVKWFVVWNDDGLDLHRSWTGHHIYRATFEPAPFGCERVARLTVNCDPAQFRAPEDDAVVAAQFASLCDVLLLERLRVSMFPDALRAPSVSIFRGDITKESADAIVNAANEALAGGGGVDGAIHRAAGPELDAACMTWPILPAPDGTRAIRAVRCPTGEARVTPAFGELRARWIIHAVGPVHGVRDHSALLRGAFDRAFDAAVEYGARRVAAQLPER